MGEVRGERGERFEWRNGVPKTFGMI